MSLTSFGTNIEAQRKRVRWYNRESSAEVIREGQPVCYMFDTTNNVLGYDKGAGGDGEEQTTPDTTAEGNQNEGKFMIVEKPYTDNLLWFAGVVASGGWVGKSVAATSYEWIEIFTPNGAIVPVRASVPCTVGRTILALETDSLELTQPLSANQGRPVAIAEETRLLSDITSVAITAFSDYSGTVAGTVRATCTHTLASGSYGIKITGTDDYDGVHTMTYIDASYFYFTGTFTATDTGTMEKNVDIVLARLCPSEFIYQDNTGDALIVATLGTSDTVVNKIRLTTAQTEGDCDAFSISLTATAQTAGSATALVASVTTVSPANTSGVYFGLTNTGTGADGFHVLQVRGNAYGTAVVGDINGVFSQITMRVGTAVSSAGVVAGIFSKVHVLTGGGTIAGDVVAARFSLGLDSAVTGKHAMFYFDSTTIIGEHVDYLFITKGASSAGEDIGYTVVGTSAGTREGVIPIYFGNAGAVRYINVYSTVGT